MTKFDIAFHDGEASHGLLLLQQSMLAMATRLLDYCNARGIPIFLIGGTALGAVRDGAIIPWDDDIDLAMLREDYDQLVASLKDSPLAGTFLQTWQSERGYYLPFAKLRRDGTIIEDGEFDATGMHRGVFVDIFIYDRLPRWKVLQSLQRQILGLLNLFIMPYGADAWFAPKGRVRRFAKRFALAVRRRTGIAPFVLMREWACRLPGVPKGDTYDSFGMLGISKYARKILRESDLVPPRLARFGALTVPVPANCERFLELHYGDWRSLPPPSCRKPGHVRNIAVEGR